MSESDVDPCLFVVFGATGDLARRKLLPAMYRLSDQKKTDRLKIVGVSRSDMNDGSFRSIVRKALESAKVGSSESVGRWCEQHLHYRSVSAWGAEQFQTLARSIGDLENQYDLPGNRVIYLALPPQMFPTTITGLGQSGLNRSRGWTRLVVEKPFGRDLASAQRLNTLAHQYFDETHTYRIDHYLGKETVQNILVFRFAKPL